MQAQNLETFISTFLAQPADAITLPDGLVDAVNHVLCGTALVTLAGEALLESLKAVGTPCTVDELERRFATFVKGALKGHDQGTARLTFER